MNRPRTPRAVVVGSGLAGLSCALELRSAGWEVTVVSPGRAGRDGATHRVHALAPWVLLTAPWVRGDSPSRYAGDLERRAAGMGRPGLAEVLAEASHETVRELVELLRLERLDGGPVLLPGDEHPRGLRCRPAAPGPLGSPLLHACRAAGVRLEDRTLAVRLAVLADRACGVEVLRRSEHRQEVLAADAVVLACGGVGAVFPATTAPRWCRGSAVALAGPAGVLLHRPGLTQTLPVTATPPLYFPTSTALLGGRLLLDGAPQQPMRDLTEATLAIARALAGGRRVELDAGSGGAGLLPARLRDSRAVSRDGLVPLTLAVHHGMGGVAIDAHGRCSLPGLYACGEAAGGVQGLRRTMGTGLVEARVFGLRAARAAAADADRLGEAPAPPPLGPLPVPAEPEAFEELMDGLMGPLAVLRGPGRVAAAAARLEAWPWEGRRGGSGEERAAMAALRGTAGITILRAEPGGAGPGGGNESRLVRALDDEEEPSWPRRPSPSP